MADISSKATLPSPRELLTSIFNSLSQTPLSIRGDSPGDVIKTYTSSPSRSDSTSNPLEAFTVMRRSLFVTLHVLFPSLLLQALDLLDRKLVTRVIQVTPSAQRQPENQRTHQLSQEPIHQAADPNPLNPQQSTKTRETHFYLVRSSQSIQHHARSHSNSAASSSRYSKDQSTRYIVRLIAWNCSCAAFAFSAFPVSKSGFFIPEFTEEPEEVPAVPSRALAGLPEALLRERNMLSERPESEGDSLQEWSFGGLSTDGMPGGTEGVPCCKHLLACLLAERCEAELGGYVREVKVDREEMAGLAADG